MPAEQAATCLARQLAELPAPVPVPGLGIVPAGYAIAKEAAGVKRPSTYARLVRDFAEVLTGCFEVTNLREALADADALVFYVDFRTSIHRVTAAGRPSRSLWQATTAADALSTIPTALRYFGLPAPPPAGASTARQQRAIARGLANHGTISRRAATIGEVCAAASNLRRRGGVHAEHSAALLCIMFYNMMRPSDVEYARSAVKIVVSQSNIVLHIHDKTHTRTCRQLYIGSTSYGLFSTHEAYLLMKRAVATQSWHALFSTRALRTVRAELRAMGRTLGNLRPGGVILHLQLGTYIPLIKKIAGWSATSNVWLDNYMDVAAAADKR